jgi:hypothetical protein
MARARNQAAPGYNLDADWSKGMVRDAPLTALPDGSCYDAIDFLLDQPGIARKRGGTVYAGPAMSGASYAKLVAYCPEFSSPLIAIGSDNHLYTVSAGATTDRGALGITANALAYRVGGGKQLLVIVGNGGVPKTWNGTTLGSLGGSPPASCLQAEVYKSRLILANNASTPQRMFFSPTPDIESTWDVTNNWVDADYPITGLATLQNAVIIFMKERVARMTGSNPGQFGDLDMAPIADIGCTDNRALAKYQNTVIFANPEGVFQTGGVGYNNLSKIGGMQSYWETLFNGYNSATWTIAAGLSNDILCLNILDNTGVPKDAFMVNLRTNAWWRLSNWRAMHYCFAPDIQNGLFYADRFLGRVVSASSVFYPQPANKLDANGTAITPFLQTRPMRASPTLNHYGFGWLHYDLRDAATDNPNLALSQATGYEAQTFNTIRESPLQETTDEEPQRFTMAKVTQAISMRIQQTGPSAKTELYGISAQVRPLPPMQLS